MFYQGLNEMSGASLSSMHPTRLARFGLRCADVCVSSFVSALTSVHRSVDARTKVARLPCRSLVTFP